MVFLFILFLKKVVDINICLLNLKKMYFLYYKNINYIFILLLIKFSCFKIFRDYVWFFKVQKLIFFF